MSRDISNKIIRQNTKHVQNATILGCTYNTLLRQHHHPQCTFPYTENLFRFFIKRKKYIRST